MHMVQEMRRLRAEHAALATLSHFLMDIVAAPRPPRPTELASVRGMFRDTLVRHLKCEDWVLYPRLKASGDAELTRLAREFVGEMGHLAEDFVAYDTRWTEARVAGDWPGFCRETEAVLDAIGMRIEREEADLYPAAERLAASLHRMRGVDLPSGRGWLPG
ncbi:MAG: hemerythrin domain-containing protein [Sphingopyxis sp.]|uniref:hemerythrin domain-containing protein n=1 Tax=Sphingopyxis sp. TaxID=1908224 RepID=UPI003D6D2AAD